MIVVVVQACGRDWKRLQEAVPGKTMTQIKNYYQNYKVKVGGRLSTCCAWPDLITLADASWLGIMCQALPGIHTVLGQSADCQSHPHVSTLSHTLLAARGVLSRPCPAACISLSAGLSQTGMLTCPAAARTGPPGPASQCSQAWQPEQQTASRLASS